MWLEICSALHWKAHLVLLWLLGACIGGGLIKDKWSGQVASETTSFHVHTYNGEEDVSPSSPSGGGAGSSVKFLHSSSIPSGGSGGGGAKRHHNGHRGTGHYQGNHHQRHYKHREEEYTDINPGEEMEGVEEGYLFEPMENGEGPPLMIGAVVQQQKLRQGKTGSQGGGVHSSSGGVIGGGNIGGSRGQDHHLHQKYQQQQSNEEFEGESGGEGGVGPDGEEIGGEDGKSSTTSSGDGGTGGGGEIKEQQEKLLLQQLMRGYERDVRPVRNASQAVVVLVGITLTQIFDMDEKNQVLTTNVWLDQEWNDELLQWDPKDFGGLEMIRIPCERIWLPDIVLYNNADDYTRGYMPSRAMVKYDGSVFWPPPTKFRSTCGVDVTYFPFDDQTCTLKLGSWTYNGYQVDVAKLKPDVDLTNYVTNGEWDLLRADIKRNVVTYPCCPEPFPDVTVTLVIRRKTLYYIYNIVLPCMMLSALTLLVFCLPPDSGEKIALGITVLLAFSVFMLAISEALPETSESIPLIGIYLTAVMAITSISVIVTVVVLNLHYLGPRVRPVPAWLKCLLPEDDVNYIRQKSLLIPAVRREPKSGSLKRRHVYIPASSDGTEPSKHSILSSGGGYDPMTPATHTPGPDGEGIAECSSTESVNDRKVSSANNPPAYSDAIDPCELRSRHHAHHHGHHHQSRSQHKNNTTPRGGSILPPEPVSSMASTASTDQPISTSTSTATTIAAATIAAAATRQVSTVPGGQGQHPFSQQNNPVAPNSNNGTVSSTTEAMCEDLVNAVRYLMSIQEQVESQNVLVAEWRLVAQAVDRILFWIFAVMTIVSSTILLLILPLYKRSTYYGPVSGGGENDTEWNLTSTTESPISY